MAGSSQPLKSLVRTKHAPGPYAAVWRRTGEDERFTHNVMACSREEAIATTKAEMLLFLGPNFDLWELETIYNRLPATSRTSPLSADGEEET